MIALLSVASSNVIKHSAPFEKHQKYLLCLLLLLFVYFQGFSLQQMSQVEKNVLSIEERVKEMASIVQSISGPRNACCGSRQFDV